METKINRNKKSKKFNYRAKISIIGHKPTNPSKLITWIGTNRIRYDEDVPKGGCELTSCEVILDRHCVIRLDFIFLNDPDSSKLIYKSSDIILLTSDGDHNQDNNTLVEIMSEGLSKVFSYWLVGNVGKYKGSEDVFVQ